MTETKRLLKNLGTRISSGARGAVSRKQMPIVPPDNVAGRAMVLVIAIMTFLSCLTLGAVTLVRDTAATWQTQIAREATIQIKPEEDHLTRLLNFPVCTEIRARLLGKGKDADDEQDQPQLS